jgi:hypothetical protein
MSRRHRGRPHHHAPAATDAPRRNAGIEPAGSPSPQPNASRAAAAAPPRAAGIGGQAVERDDAGSPERAAPAPADSAATGRPATPAPTSTRLDATEHLTPVEAGHERPPSGGIAGQPPVNGDRSGQCTAPQLRRFIKSRPYVPMHELRRRFGINGEDDDVTPVRIDPGWIFVGLPNHEGHLLGDLLRTGEIGYELSLDPRTPIVVGVYPMRPIPRT